MLNNPSPFAAGRLLPLFLLFALLQPQEQVAQSTPSTASVEATITELDRQFWVAYNSCDVTAMMTFVDEDIEFYHDLGGETHGRAELERAMREGLCRNDNNEVERRPQAETIHVFPMASDGAIIRGQHQFIGVKHPGEDGTAAFFHHWKRKGERWVMTRVFSYDHQLLPANGGLSVLTLPPGSLEKFTGSYQAPQTGKVSITHAGNTLLLNNGNGVLKLYAKTPTIFFNRELPLEFHFQLDGGRVTAFSVWEKGREVEVATKVSTP